MEFIVIIVGRFKIMLLIIDESFRHKINRNIEIVLYYTPNGPKRHLQNLSSNSYRKHILLISTWNLPLVR
jgi:hypothetical protein